MVPTAEPTVQHEADPAAVEAVAERLFGEGAGAFHLFSVYLGTRLGWFAALADRPRRTAAELATDTGTDERYAREWLQAETIAGLVISDGDDYTTARFELAPGVREALVDEVSPAYVGGIALAVASVGSATTALLAAYRTGAGVPVDAYGPDMIHAQSAFNRPMYANDLAATFVPQIPGLADRLADPNRPARVADIGCGCGWGGIELAKAFPHIVVNGFDNDVPSIQQARSYAADEGVADRVGFAEVDAARGYGQDEYDAIFFFECVHDLPRPVEALAAARAAVKPGGVVVVMDERTGERPAVGDPVESFFATVSATWCLPQSRVDPDCEAPGTVMRPATLEGFARRAGWAGVDVLPIEHPFFRFYRLAD